MLLCECVVQRCTERSATATRQKCAATITACFSDPAVGDDLAVRICGGINCTSIASRCVEKAPGFFSRVVQAANRPWLVFFALVLLVVVLVYASCMIDS
jgi:hypothetical protein